MAWNPPTDHEIREEASRIRGRHPGKSERALRKLAAFNIGTTRGRNRVRSLRRHGKVRARAARERPVPKDLSRHEAEAEAAKLGGRARAAFIQALGFNKTPAEALQRARERQ